MTLHLGSDVRRYYLAKDKYNIRGRPDNDILLIDQSLILPPAELWRNEELEDYEGPYDVKIPYDDIYSG